MKRCDVDIHRALEGNNLLRSLRDTDRALVAPFLSAATLETGDELHRPGDPIERVWFPCGPSLVSFQVVLPDGQAIETALVGREGAVGGIVGPGRLPAFARATVQFPGLFLRMPADALVVAQERSRVLSSLVSRYADCLLAQVFQATACNAAHTIEQRAAKWLLAAIDRTGDHVLPLTQEQLAGLLGVGRSYANRVIRDLRTRGVLRTRRGVIEVVDFDGLCDASCHCQEAVREHFDRVLEGVYPADHPDSDCREAAVARLMTAG